MYFVRADPYTNNPWRRKLRALDACINQFRLYGNRFGSAAAFADSIRISAAMLLSEIATHEAVTDSFSWMRAAQARELWNRTVKARAGLQRRKRPISKDIIGLVRTLPVMPPVRKRRPGLRCALRELITTDDPSLNTEHFAALTGNTCSTLPHPIS